MPEDKAAAGTGILKTRRVGLKFYSGLTKIRTRRRSRRQYR
ncbi:TPA: hypothetical protein ACFOVJ_000908 [Neisseria meningitidis]|uniref:Uncharacterized protein n=2 Tax=Neisseria meningitidis TaxID=487 RepID=E0N9J8_NEIM3|nr:hypothetical protein [Neisseria meningitidis]EFM04369.1 hypothetical protein HMPREF0602_1178 [Neisseria meningitidis ATCC 13091]CBA08771.1 hypothetical protein predicted by Glimmer/Critica [Neisseria meningitidis alpha153]MCV6718430.1 hypothetical protein [Neisseria meningitidis]MCV6720639.1 hypothetical protein [Neisseria meningitidis]MCV6722934.1 hypothetical protein [Neisseria meningitidis]